MPWLLDSVPLTDSKPLSTHASTGISWIQASLAHSLVGSLLLSPGSWGTQGFVCALQESVSLVLCKFCNQSPLAFKIKFPGGSQSLCLIPRLGNILWTPELSQQCENFFGIIVWLLSSLWVVCLVALWWGLHTTPSRSVASRAPVPMAGHCWPMQP